jgi:hypothetical protein
MCEGDASADGATKTSFVAPARIAMGAGPGDGLEVQVAPDGADFSRWLDSVVPRAIAEDMRAVQGGEGVSLLQKAVAEASVTSGIAPANATLDEEFTRITSVRELSDGRVLIADEKENRLVLADFSTGEVKAIGRMGRGPGEYAQVGRLWPLAADSTLMVDPFSRRWHVIVGGRMIDVEPRVTRASEGAPIAGASEDGGILYAVHSRKLSGKLTGLRDSMFVLRFPRAGAAPDTIGRLPSEFANVDPTRQPQTLRFGSAPARPKVFRAAVEELDHIVMLPDGWVAIARTRPYRVDWCPPAGACVVGPTIEAVPEAISEADKLAYMQSAIVTAGWPDDVKLEETIGWPRRLPPFSGRTYQFDFSPLVPVADGTLLVERVASAQAPPRQYDHIDRRGTRVARYRLPVNEQIIALGGRSVYVIVTDENGAQRLRQHPWL